MKLNPYDPDITPRVHAGAQALIDHFRNSPHHTTIPRHEAMDIIMDTGLAERTADNIIIKLKNCTTISITGRGPIGQDDRTQHHIRRGTRWDKAEDR